MSQEIVSVVGLQWGDEGKGKLVDILASNALSCARFNGGANAGHSLVVGPHKIACHLLPCGIMHPQCCNIIGNGVVVSLEALASELDTIEAALGQDVSNRLVISSRAHLLFRTHIAADRASERALSKTSKAIGTTLRGIGPAYASKALRISLRVSDIFKPWEEFCAAYMRQHEFFARAYNFQPSDVDIDEELRLLQKLIKRFAPCVKDLPDFFATQLFAQSIPTGGETLERKWHMVTEGANATWLDLNCGTYPYCSSSETLTSGCGGGLSVSPREIKLAIGVVKAYTTRVGEGPFPTELFDDIGKRLQQQGAEFGVSTGRPRRCGWFDSVIVRIAAKINGVDGVMVTKLDVLSGFDKLNLAVRYTDADGTPLSPFLCPSDMNGVGGCVYETMDGWTEDITQVTDWSALPLAAQNYVRKIEELIQSPVLFVGVSPDRSGILKVPPRHNTSS